MAAAGQVTGKVDDAQNCRLQQRGRWRMEFFSGLDVGMDETAECVVDDKGKVMLEVTEVTDPQLNKAVLKPYLARLRRVGHEAGALSPWLHPELLKLSLPAICLETQHVRSAMSAQRNDGFPAALLQRCYAVDERGRLHGASALATIAVYRVIAWISASCRSEGE